MVASLNDVELFELSSILIELRVFNVFLKFGWRRSISVISESRIFSFVCFR